MINNKEILSCNFFNFWINFLVLQAKYTFASIYGIDLHIYLHLGRLNYLMIFIIKLNVIINMSNWLKLKRMYWFLFSSSPLLNLYISEDVICKNLADKCLF